MILQPIVLDPAPEAARGTLEYAASATACRFGINARLAAQEAADILAVMREVDLNHADASLHMEAWRAFRQALETFRLPEPRTREHS